MCCHSLNPSVLSVKARASVPCGFEVCLTSMNREFVSSEISSNSSIEFLITNLSFLVTMRSPLSSIQIWCGFSFVALRIFSSVQFAVFSLFVLYSLFHRHSVRQFLGPFSADHRFR